jgi:hypothetical protein
MPLPFRRVALVATAFSGAFACAGTGAVAQTPAPPAAAPALQAGASIVAGPGALLGRLTRLEGTLPELAAGGAVQIERLTPGRGWVAEATATAGPGGAYVARWRPRRLGRFEVRAVPGGDTVRAAAVSAPTTSVTVYRPARATWYGPGFYGRRTACGQVLSHRLMGVAHKRLPCGTPIELYLAGRTITVPVVDRGPFANGASYDLTSAAAEQLGLTVTSTLGAAPRRGQRMEPPRAPLPPLAGTGGVTSPAVPPAAP